MHVFRRNKWRANNGKAGDKHINFIKPAMVDMTGTPMFGRTPFMDKNSAVYNPASISFGYQSNSAAPVMDKGLRTASKNGGVGGNAPVPVYAFGSVFGNDSGYTFNDDGYLYDQKYLQDDSGGSLYSYLFHGAGTNNVTIAGRNSTHVGSEGNVPYTQVNDYVMWKNTLVARAGNVAATEVAYPWLPCATYSPALWPDFQPCTLSGETDDYEVDSIIGKTKVSEYMKYLANVRSLPIGVSGIINASTYATSVAAMAAATTANVNAPNCSFTEYRVSMPFVSGIYGILADKMFPDLLIGANNIRIEFKLASNNKALWLTMDPCRRVPGTVRDFAPFTGASDGSARFGTSLPGTGFISASQDNSGTTILPENASLGCTCAMLYSGFTANDAGLAYKNTLSTYVATDSGAIIAGSYIYNTSSAMGEDLVAAQPLIDYSQGTQQTSGTITCSLGPDGTLTVTAIGDLAAPIEAGNIVSFTGLFVTITGQKYVDQNFGGTGQYYTATFGLTITSADHTLLYFNNAYATNAQSKSKNGYSLSPYSNLPKPQYIPTATPWLQKAVGTFAAPTIASYCNENAACYGTYLPASVPQTRRCQVSSRLNISDQAFASNGTTAFAIRDLQVRGFAPYNPLFCCAKR